MRKNSDAKSITGILTRIALLCMLLILLTAFGVEKVYATADVQYVGDIDGDGVITPKDVTTLRRYLAKGWNVDVAVEDADVDSDGDITPKDVTMLRRYLAKGWGVELPEKPKEKSVTSNAYMSRNLNMNMYDGNWYHPIYSYLYKEGDYICRAERDSDGEGKLYIEKYDNEWKLIDTTIVEYGREYIWGGLYIGEQYNFIVVGQTNYEEDDNKVVFQIRKYDKLWNEIGTVDIKGANTVDPFSAGTLRCAEKAGYLYITTCHKMYKYSDGNNHQANVLIVIDEESMKIIDQVTGMVGGGYVSHSFNQFIEATSDGGVYRIDQGDYYPRGILMAKVWKEAYSTLTFQKFKDAISESMFDVNKTGAQIAGIKESGEGFAIAYIYDDRGGQGETAPNYIYVLNVPKALIDKTSNSPILGLKYYNIYGDYYLYDGPLMCSLGYDNGGIILWKEKEKKYISGSGYEYFDEGTVCYVRYYPNGSVSEVFSFDGKLSDCEPIAVNGNVLWYVTDGGVPEFYELDPENGVVYRYYADGEDFDIINTTPRYDFKISAVADTPADIISIDDYETVDYWDATYRLHTERENGIIEDYLQYSDGGWKSEKKQYNSDNRIIKKVTSKSDGSWETVEYTYDDNGNQIKEFKRNSRGEWLSTETGYDENGKKCREYVLNKDGQFSEKEFNVNGKCIKEHKLNSAGEYLILTEYDENNHKTKETVKTDEIEQVFEYRFKDVKKDNYTRRQEMLMSQMNTFLTDGSWIKYEYTYNDDFIMDSKRTTDSDGYEAYMSRVYDDEKRLILETQIDPSGTSTGEYSYDENGNGRCVWRNADGTIEIYETDEYGVFQRIE